MRGIIVLIMITASFIHAGEININSTDFSNAPEMQANIYAYDSEYKLVHDLEKDMMELFENGIKREITSLDCPGTESTKISSVLVLDISKSMNDSNRIQQLKDAATGWVDRMPDNGSECAVISFNDEVKIDHGFSTDKVSLKKSISELQTSGSTDYDKVFHDPQKGMLEVAKRGKYKKIIIFVSDGAPSSAGEIDQDKANEEISLNDITFFGVTLVKQQLEYLKNISENSGGIYFDDITNTSEIVDIFDLVNEITVKYLPCTVQWQSGFVCEDRKVELRMIIEEHFIDEVSYFDYPESLYAGLDFSPKSVFFENKNNVEKYDTTIQITAKNYDFTVANISTDNSEFEISPSYLELEKGVPQEVTLTYEPQDDNYSTGKLTFQTDLCDINYYASGVHKKSFQVKKLELLKPDGGEKLLAGSDYQIQWEGVSPVDEIELEYSTDNGNNWFKIGSSKNFEFNWTNIPYTPSDRCLMKAVKSGTEANNMRLKKGDVSDIKYVDDSENVLSAGEGIFKWNKKSNNSLINEFNDFNNYVSAIDVHSAASKIAVGDVFGNISIYDDEFALIMDLQKFTDKITDIEWGNLGRHLAVAGKSSLKIFDTDEDKSVFTI